MKIETLNFVRLSELIQEIKNSNEMISESDIKNFRHLVYARLGTFVEIDMESLMYFYEAEEMTEWEEKVYFELISIVKKNRLKNIFWCYVD